MVLKQKYFNILLCLFCNFSCFCFDSKSGLNPFDVSSLLFDKEGVYITSQNIDCSENGIGVSYVLKNSTERALYVPATIACMPLEFQTAENEIPIPLGFKILINEIDIDFDVNKNNEINFNMTIPSEEKIVVKVFYQNLQNVGINQTRTNFKYLIKLQKNKNNEPIDYNFSYMSSKDSEACIENILIFDNNDIVLPKVNLDFFRKAYKVV